MAKDIRSKVKLPSVGVTGREGAPVNIGFGAAAAQIGDAFMQATDMVTASRETDDFSGYNIELAKRGGELVFKHQNMDWRGNDDKFAADHKIIRNEISARINNVDVRKKFDLLAERGFLTSSMSLKRRNFSKEKTARVTDFNSNVEVLTDHYLKVESQEERDLILEQLTDGYDVLSAGGWVTPEYAADQKKAMSQGLTFEIAKVRVETDHLGVLKDLGAAQPIKPPKWLLPIVGGAIDGTDISANYMFVTAKRESSFKPSVKAGSSSATGLYQFTAGTWKDVTTKHGGLLPLAMRNDPKTNAKMAVYFAQDNKIQVEAALGRRITDGELYIAHFMGAGGGSKFLKAFAAQPNANAAVMFVKSAAANPTIFYHSKGSGKNKTTDFSRPKTIAEVYAERVGQHDGGNAGKVAGVYEGLTYVQQNGLKAAARKQNALYTTEMDGLYKQMTGNIAKGIAPRDVDIDRISKLAYRIDRPDIIEQVQAFDGLSDMGEAWRQADLDTVRGDVAALNLLAKGDDATQAEISQAQFGNNRLAAMTKAVDADPINFAISAEFAVSPEHEPIRPIDFNIEDATAKNIAKFDEVLHQRALDARGVQGFYGNEMRYFSNLERQGLSNLFGRADAFGKEQLSAMLYHNFGDDLPKFLTEFSENGAADALTIDLAASGNLHVANLSHVGAVALKEKTVKLPTDKDLSLVFNEYVGSAIPVDQAQIRGPIFQVAKQIYAGKISMGLVSGDKLDEAVFKASVNEALGKNGENGGIVEGYNGQRYLLPNNMSKDDIDTIDEEATNETIVQMIGLDIEAIHGDRSAFLPDQFPELYKVNYGTGRYKMSVTDPKIKEELIIDAKTGDAVVFDYNNIDPAATAEVTVPESDTAKISEAIKTRYDDGGRSQKIEPKFYHQQVADVLGFDNIGDFLYKYNIITTPPPYEIEQTTIAFERYLQRNYNVRVKIDKAIEARKKADELRGK